MTLEKWILMGIFALLLAVMVVLKALHISPTHRGIVKLLLSSCFMAAAIWGYTSSSYKTCDIILVIGLAFAMLGDIFLIWLEDRKPFVAGVYSFACASATLVVYSILRYGFVWWGLILFAVVVAACLLAQRKGIFSFGKNIVHLNVYTLFVGLCGSLGCTVLFRSLGIEAVLFGAGCLLYMLSDLLLGLYLFKYRNRVVDCANTLTYFPGMMLIALSLLIIL